MPGRRLGIQTQQGGSVVRPAPPPAGTIDWTAYPALNLAAWPNHQCADNLGDPDTGGTGRGTYQLLATDGGIVAPGGVMNKITLHANPSAKIACEMLHPRDYPDVIGKTEYYLLGWYFPSVSNWDADWEGPGTSYNSGCVLAQIGFTNLASANIMLRLWDLDAFGEVGPYVGVSILSGDITATIEYINTVSVSDWTVHDSSAGARAAGRYPQVAGPHTFLAGNHPLTLDAWNWFIVGTKWATTVAGNGFADVWHAVAGDPFTHVYHWDGPTAQWSSTIGVDTNGYQAGSPYVINDKAGAYVNHTDSELILYHAKILRGSTYAIVEAQA